MRKCEGRRDGEQHQRGQHVFAVRVNVGGEVFLIRLQLTAEKKTASGASTSRNGVQPSTRLSFSSNIDGSKKQAATSVIGYSLVNVKTIGATRR